MDSMRGTSFSSEGRWIAYSSNEDGNVSVYGQPFCLAEQQIVEHRAARVIDACDLAIEHGTLDARVLTDPLRHRCLKLRKVFSFRETRS